MREIRLPTRRDYDLNRDQTEDGNFPPPRPATGTRAKRGLEGSTIAGQIAEVSTRRLDIPSSGRHIRVFFPVAEFLLQFPGRSVASKG
jgi:hypothetical protein